eukprot:1156585-Pelagomonas_calceolata.AAC.6
MFPISTFAQITGAVLPQEVLPARVSKLCEEVGVSCGEHPSLEEMAQLVLEVVRVHSIQIFQRQGRADALSMASHRGRAEQGQSLHGAVGGNSAQGLAWSSGMIQSMWPRMEQ